MKVVAIAFSSLLLLSCQQSDVVPEPVICPVSDLMEAQLAFRIDMEGQVETRTATAAPRELQGIDNLQKADNVRIYVFQSTTPGGTYTYTPLITYQGDTLPYIHTAAFEKTEVWNGDTQGIESHEYSVPAYLPKYRYYRFLAVGRDDITETDSTHVAYDFRPTPQTTLDEAAATLRPGRQTGTELFTGKSDTPLYTDPEETPEKIEITMTRAVAGLLLYVDSVPHKLRDDHGDMHTVGSVGIAPLLYMTRSLLLATPQPDGLDVRTDEPYVRAYVPEDQTYNDVANIYTNTNPAYDQDQAPHCHSLPLVGAFLTPQNDIPEFPAVVGHTPLRLVYYDLNGDVIASSPIHIKVDHYGKPNATAATAINYDILPNHIYCMGVKNESGSIDAPASIAPDPNYTYNKQDITIWGTWQEIFDLEM